jgi:outer membrane lipoprotein-sorting protein
MVSLCFPLAGTGRSLTGLGAGLLLSGAVLSAGAAQDQGLLDAWFDAQAKVRTWSADFVQTRSLQALSQPLVATGKVWVAIPSHFRWELGQPPQTIALRDPEKMYVVYPRLKRAEKYALDEKQPKAWREAIALLEAGFPRNRADMESRFRLLSVQQTNNTVTFTLQSRSAPVRKLLSEMRVSLRTNDFSLTATEISFSDGSRLRNDFYSPTVNPALPEDCFQARLGLEFKVVEPLKQ